MAYSVLRNYFTVQSEENLRIKKKLENICEKYNSQENQILLAFLLKHPARIIPVIGSSPPEKMVKIKESLNISLEHDDWLRLLEAKNGTEIN